MVSVDIHDDTRLQNKQVEQMLARMRREAREMVITRWPGLI